MNHCLIAACSALLLFWQGEPDRDELEDRLGELFAQGDAALEAGELDDALAHYEEALEVNLAIIEIDPDDTRTQLNRASLMQRMGRVHRDAGRLNEAVAVFQENHTNLEALDAAHPGDDQIQQWLATSFTEVGNALNHLGQYEDALASIDRSLEIEEQFALAEPTNLALQDEFIDSLRSVGQNLALESRYEPSVRYLKRACDVSRQTLAIAPNDLVRRYQHFTLLSALAHAHFPLVEFEECRDCWQEGIEVAEGTVDIDPEGAGWRYDLAFAHEALGTVQSGLREYENAIMSHELGIEIVEEMFEQMDVSRDLEEQARSSLTNWRAQLSEARRCLIADGPWDALLENSHDEVVVLLYIRCAIKSRDGDMDEIVRSAEKLEELALLKLEQQADTLRYAATGYAICAKLAVGWRPPGPYPTPGAAEPTTEQLERQRTFIARSLTALHASIEQGLVEYEWLHEEPYFDALRGVPEFEALFEADEE